MAEERSAGLGQRPTAMFHFEHGSSRAEDKQMIECLRRIGDDPKCAGADGFFNEAVAVGRAALHGHKNCARAHSARVVFHSRNGCAGTADRFDRINFGSELIPSHHGHCMGFVQLSSVTMRHKGA